MCREILLVGIVSLALFATCHAADFRSDPPYYAARYTGLPAPRGLYLDEAGDILVMSNPLLGTHGAEAVFDEPNEDGSVNVCRVKIVDGAGLNLNHAITYNRGYLYMSSPSAVYRWPYTPGQRTPITTPSEVVINGMPTAGHNTRTLIFDAQNRLYVAIGSNANVDQNSDRARIRRFVFDGASFPIAFGTGEVFADGLRNEVGLDFDVGGTLWGVENGADNLNRPDIGGDVHNGNPAEEMNRFGEAVGTHYGYPYCFSTYNLTGVDAGTQYAWPSFMNDGLHTDEWCRNPANNRPPTFSMPAHQAPLGIEFYKGQNCVVPGAFPCSAVSDAFVAFHGSWNSVIKVGYKVTRYMFDKLALMPTGTFEDVLYTPDVASCVLNCFRAVNSIFDAEGHLVVSADSSNELVKIYYGQEPPVFIEGCRDDSKHNSTKIDQLFLMNHV